MSAMHAIMNGAISFALFIFVCANAAPFDYWTLRAELVAAEREYMIGGNLRFQPGEREANTILMRAKEKEIQYGFANPSAFLPAQNFLKAKEDIEKSEVFKIIRNLPKGAVLHSHDTAISSINYILSNITYRENLYVCDLQGVLHLKFFNKPTDECNWKLLSKLRKNPAVAEIINRRIRQQLTMMTDDPDKTYSDVNKAWTKFGSIFRFIEPLLTYRPVYEDHFYRGLQELYDDNVFYLELRTTLPTIYELDGTTYSPIEVVGIYKAVAERFVADHPNFLGVKLIYAPARLIPERRLAEHLRIMKKLKETYPSFVIGFDLVGQEDKGVPLVTFANDLRNVSPDINFFFHAGETDWYGMSSDENLVDAVLLNAKRIGHGFAVLKHPMIYNEIRRRKIAVEVNPISNQVLALVKDLRNHPASVLFSVGFPVVVSNDDPGLWGSKGLSYDFYEAFMGLMSRKADLRSLKQLAINSILYSSMNDDEKARAFDFWQMQWQYFVENLTGGVPHIVRE